MKFAVVAIGRNEGLRLKTCLTSLSAASRVVYVDSGSTDESIELAQKRGADVVTLDMNSPFTAARARNAGFRRLHELVPDLCYVQFIDGDCEMQTEWPELAVSYLDLHPNVAAVCGRRRERFPERSIYNWLCDLEWNGPVGEIKAFGGDVMMRANAFKDVKGYRDDLIAGEEPELCVRLRKAGWRIWRLDAQMTLHDAAMIRFGQWWRRAIRAGYAFAQGAHLHGTSAERHYAWESRRTWLWGIWIPLACVISGLAFGPWGWATWLIYPLQVLRQTTRIAGPLSHRVKLAIFQLLARFPEAQGQILFVYNRLVGRRAQLIEYKR